MDPLEIDADAPVYVISVAAQLTGLHPQTLRQYDRIGLVCPMRVRGRNRLYSASDIEQLRQIAQLSAEGMSLAGIRRVLHLEAEVDHLRTRLSEFIREKTSTALVPYQPRRKKT
jgi:MerR family transcriptional regulator/heat shock protein HspR